MLDMIQGVSESSIPKQRGEPTKEANKMETEGVKKPASGGDDKDQKPKIIELKFNTASSLRCKEKLVNNDEEEEEDENVKLKRKSRDVEIDNNL